MAQNGLTEPPALTSVFIVFVYSATQVFASDPNFADLMIFRLKNDLRLLECAYIRRREVKRTLSQTFERLDLYSNAFGSGSIYLQKSYLYYPNTYSAICADYINTAWANSRHSSYLY